MSSLCRPVNSGPCPDANELAEENVNGSLGDELELDDTLDELELDELELDEFDASKGYLRGGSCPEAHELAEENGGSNDDELELDDRLDVDELELDELGTIGSFRTRAPCHVAAAAP